MQLKNLMAIVLVIGIMLIAVTFVERPTLKVGQVWEYCQGDEDDPFTPVTCERRTILAIQDGYVQYSSAFMDDSFIASERTPIFLYGDTTLIQDK